MSLPFWKSTQQIRLEPNDRYKSNWEAFVDKQYDNAYNYYYLQKEVGYGTNEYEDINLRIDGVFDANTGLKLSDDWQALIYPNGLYPQMGERYYFMNNIWISVNVNSLASPTSKCIIHRCNNKISLLDKFSNIYEEPCIIDPSLKYGNVYYNNSVNVAQGSINIWLQLNEYTKDISINDKFTIGYNEVYRVRNVINYLSDTTFDKDGSRLIRIECDLQPIQPGDDFENGITSSTPIVETKNNITSIMLTPSNSMVLQGKKVVFTCNSYLGDNIVADTFVFTLIENGVPSDRYVYEVIDSNSFSVENIKKYSKSNISINCKSINTNFERTFQIMMGGDYY